MSAPPILLPTTLLCLRSLCFLFCYFLTFVYIFINISSSSSSSSCSGAHASVSLLLNFLPMLYILTCIIHSSRRYSPSLVPFTSRPYWNVVVLGIVCCCCVGNVMVVCLLLESFSIIVVFTLIRLFIFAEFLFCRQNCSFGWRKSLRKLL